MKRFIAVFGVIFIITMHCLSFYPANAAINSVDYGEMLNIYLGAAETAMAASQGVTIDWSNLELPADSDTWTDKQKAQYIVQYVGNLKKVGQHFIYEWLFGEDNDTFDVISANTAAIGLAKNSNLYTLDIKAQLDNILATQSQEHVFQRYSDKVIARWNEYNTNYINDYLSFMDTIEETDINAPVSSSSNVLTVNYSGNNNLYCNVGVNYSFTFANKAFNNNLYPAALGISASGWEGIYAFVGGNLYKNNSRETDNCLTYLANIGTDYFNILYDNVPVIENAIYYIGNTPYLSNEALIYLQTGVYGTNISTGLSVTLPNAVIDNSSEDGKIVAHPIYYPDAMNIDQAIDIDLDKVIDAITSKIAQGIDSITFDDLVDAGAAVKIDGTTLTDADTVVKDVSVPIAKARVDTIDGVIPTIDIVPPLPPLPPLTPGDYSGEGFNGMTVLARIINVTVQGLPEPLILTFFGVVFGAVILGIIKILHH